MSRFFYLLATAALCFVPISAPLDSPENVILVDQIGYRPPDAKVAFLRSSIKGDFEVVNLASGKVEFKHAIPSLGQIDPSTGDKLFDLDFTPLRLAGNYMIRIAGSSIASSEFRVGPDIYDAPLKAALESFYYQRCGTEVQNETIWHHAPCHLRDATMYGTEKQIIPCIGGWHDAGDYGKYVPTGAVSAGYLLYLYEDKPSMFTDRESNIPEAGNHVPDLLDEVRWELSWLLEMQDSSGGVHHKVSALKWTGEHMPNLDPDTRYLFSISSAATADFAAVTALGAREFERWDKSFSRELLADAVKAWKYLEEHPHNVPEGGFKNPPDVEGGEYGDPNDADERLWASVELYRTTDQDQYLHYVLDHYRAQLEQMAPVSWQQVQDFAFSSFMRSRPVKGDAEVRKAILEKLTDRCESILHIVASNGYRIALAPNEFYWGSNSIDAAYAFDLISGYNLTGSSRFLDAALDQLHYLLGRNTFGISFVTGVGSRPVQNPYHQFSMMLRAGAPVPGLLVGGPNASSRLHDVAISTHPGACYEDSEKNYYVNEVAINYTAPFAFLCGYMSHLSELALK